METPKVVTWARRNEVIIIKKNEEIKLARQSKKEIAKLFATK